MRVCHTVRFAFALNWALGAGLATAANYYWDDGTVTVDGASGGGSGAWTVGAAGWENGAAAVNWANNNTAVLGGTAGTLTLGGAITAAGITVQTTGYTISSAYALSAGNLSLGANSLSFTSTVASAFNLTNLTGTGNLSLCNGANSLTLSGLSSAGAVNFNGTLTLRGGNASAAPGTVYAHWCKLGNTGVSQAAGTAFALDTGAITNDAKDLILSTDDWGGKTLTLSSLTGYGAIRSDWGNATAYKTIVVTQSVTTTFNGMILSHGTSSASRKVALVKAGSGQLTLAGIVGLQTSGAAGTLSNHVVDIDVKGGTLVMTANNTTAGSIFVRTNATLKMQNASAGTGFTGGNSLMTGSYVVEPGGKLQGFRNGTSAFGAGSIVLVGSTLAQEQGNWTWPNSIVLSNGTASTLENQSSNTGTRYLKIQGAVSGGGDLTFSDTTGGMGADTGFIFTGTNTLSGTVTIPANRKVRVGGVPGADASASAGPGGTLGSAAIVNNGTLTFSRSDAQDFANAISGSGSVRVGSAGIAGCSNQVATLSGTNTYTGSTGVNAGALLVNGSHAGGSLYAVGTNATLGGCGSIAVTSGGTIALQPGATLAPGAAPNAGGTLTLNTLTLSNAVTIAVDAPTDLVVVTGDLILNNNPVTIANTASFSKSDLIPFLTCPGGVSGSLPAKIAGTHWHIRRVGNTFYLQYNYGTLISAY